MALLIFYYIYLITNILLSFSRDTLKTNSGKIVFCSYKITVLDMI